MHELMPKLPQELQRTLEQYYSAPTPRPQFASRLEAQLRQKVEQTRPRQAVSERTSFMKLLHTRPLVAILIVLLILAILSGVAYAIGKATGYIPGVGLVDQSEPLRVLAEPVIVRRAGITLTVEQLIVSADKTVLVYKVEGIPVDAYPVEDNGTPPSQAYSSVITTEGTPESSQPTPGNNDRCNMDGDLLLPNHQTLMIHEAQGNGWTSGFESRLVYEAIAPDLNSVIFSVPCIYGTVPGALPRDWKIPLQLIPASPDLTIFPVVNVTPSVSPGNKSQAAMTLEQVIETDDGYILIGKFRSIGLPGDGKANGLSRLVRVTDANGHELEALTDNNLPPSTIFGEFPWGYEIKGKQHAWPLTLTIEAVRVEFDGPTTEFEFDTGPNPQVGQKWNLNQDVQLDGYAIRVVSIERTKNGYAFTFKADPNVTGITPNIKDFPFTSGSGGDDGFGKGDLFFTIEYPGEPPSGKLTIELGWLRAGVHGPWQVQWSPGNIAPTP